MHKQYMHKERGKNKVTVPHEWITLARVRTHITCSKNQVFDVKLIKVTLCSIENFHLNIDEIDRGRQNGSMSYSSFVLKRRYVKKKILFITIKSVRKCTLDFLFTENRIR